MPGPARSPRASGKKKTVAARFAHNDRRIDALMTQAFASLRISPDRLPIVGCGGCALEPDR
jgi:hypothetical protein